MSHVEYFILVSMTFFHITFYYGQSLRVFLCVLKAISKCAEICNCCYRLLLSPKEESA